ncbi:hypothetical protein [Pseudonocardia sp. ICBG1034]|uniref:hypothetical protein n=1 Tax=Pseudonocardia sp. ICBG1034 TaxID=2844381 RepID=UPI001CCB556F|nr:hypothetical protein [Pseudonocardia sp. ICBG1034]
MRGEDGARPGLDLARRGPSGGSGLVYGGLLWPARVHRELAALLRADGFSCVDDAVGADL